MPYLAGSKAFHNVMKKGQARYIFGVDMGADEIVSPMGGADLDGMFVLGDAIGDLIAQSSGKECRNTRARKPVWGSSPCPGE